MGEVKLNFEYDEITDCLTIEGQKYSGHIFRSFSCFPRGQLFMFIENKSGVVTVKTVRNEVDFVLEKQPSAE